MIGVVGLVTSDGCRIGGIVRGQLGDITARQIVASRHTGNLGSGGVDTVKRFRDKIATSQQFKVAGSGSDHTEGWDIGRQRKMGIIENQITLTVEKTGRNKNPRISRSQVSSTDESQRPGERSGRKHLPQRVNYSL